MHNRHGFLVDNFCHKCGGKFGCKYFIGRKIHGAWEIVREQE